MATVFNFIQFQFGNIGNQFGNWSESPQQNKIRKIEGIQQYLNKMMKCFDITEAGEGGLIYTGNLMNQMSMLDYSISQFSGQEPKVEEQKNFQDELKVLREQIKKYPDNTFNRGTVNIVTEQVSKLNKILNAHLQDESKKKADKEKNPVIFSMIDNNNKNKEEPPMKHIEKFFTNLQCFGTEESETIIKRMRLDAVALTTAIHSTSMDNGIRIALLGDIERLSLLVNKQPPSKEILNENLNLLDKLQSNYTEILNALRTKLNKIQKVQDQEIQSQELQNQASVKSLQKE